MKQYKVVTFDIGGTNIRAASLDISEVGKWKFLDRKLYSTPNYLLKPSTPASQLLDDVVGFIVDYANFSYKKFEINMLSAAFPGPIRDESIVMALPTLWGADGQDLCPINLKKKLHEALPMFQMKIMNDVTAAGYRFINENKDFAIFTLGSGIGLKVFINGQPCLGPQGMGGELTHMVFDSSPDAPVCDCGGRGHLGALCSGRAWERVKAEAQARGRGTEPDLLSFTEPLARAIAMLHFSLGIERFILAGGLAEGLGEPLRIAVVQNLPRQGWDIGQNWDAMLKLAPPDDAHALIGGALAFGE